MGGRGGQDCGYLMGLRPPAGYVFHIMEQHLLKVAVRLRYSSEYASL